MQTSKPLPFGGRRAFPLRGESLAAEPAPKATPAAKVEGGKRFKVTVGPLTRVIEAETAFDAATIARNQEPFAALAFKPFSVSELDANGFRIGLVFFLGLPIAIPEPVKAAPVVVRRAWWIRVVDFILGAEPGVSLADALH